MKKGLLSSLILVAVLVSSCVTISDEPAVAVVEEKPAPEPAEVVPPGETQPAIVELRNLSDDPVVQAYFIPEGTKDRGPNLVPKAIAPGQTLTVDIPAQSGQLVLQFDTPQGAQSLSSPADFRGSETFVVNISTDFAPSAAEALAGFGAYDYLGYDYLSYNYLPYGYMGN